MYESSIAKPEVFLGADDTFGWLAYAGSDERKLLIILALSNSGEPLGRSGLHSALSELAGEKLPGQSSANFRFVENGLARVNAVEEVSVHFRRFDSLETARGYRISNEGEEFGVPFAGMLLEWSLNHPELSLNQIFGTPNNSSSIQTAQLRYWILQDVLSNQNNPAGPSIVNLAANLNVSKKARHADVERLIKQEIIVKESVNQNNPRQFKIINPQYTKGKGKRPFSQLRPETKIIFNTLQKAADLKEIWEFDEFLKFAEQMHSSADESTLVKARQRLIQSITTSDPSFKRNLVDMSGRAFDAGSNLFIQPDKITAVQELLKTIEAFFSSVPGTIAKGRIQSNEIISDPNKVRELYLKARRHSNYANLDKDIDMRMLGIIKKLGSAATAQAISEIYAQKTGRRVTLPVVYDSLDRLIQKNAVAVEKKPQSKQKARLIGRYSLID